MNSLPPIASSVPGTAPAGGGPSTGTSASRAPVTVSVLVPSATPATAPLARARPAYVSTATHSLALEIGSQSLGSLDVGPTAPNCKSAAGGLSCTGSFSVPLGTNTFTLSAFDAPNGTGNVLSTATVQATITAGAANTIAATLDGVVASLALALPTTPTVQGTAATLALTVTARDADGRTIVGDPYANPITLSGGDATRAPLSQTTVLSPADHVSIAYDGSRLTALTFSASVPGATAATVTLPAPKTPFSDDWLLYGHDAQHTGSDANESALSTSNVAQLQQRYTVALSSFVNAQPVVATNVFIDGAYRDLGYVGDEHGEFVAFDVKTGVVLWTKHLGSQTEADCHDIPDTVFGITGTAYVDRASNRVYVVDGQDTMWAFDLATGNVAGASGSLAAWPSQGISVLSGRGSPTTEHVYGGLTYNPANGAVYVATASICDFGRWNGRLVAVDLASATVGTPFYPVTDGPNSWGGGIWGPGGVSLDPRGNGNVYTAIGNAETVDDNGLGDEIARWDANLGLIGANLPDTSGNTSGRTDLDFGATPVIFQAPGCGGPQLVAMQKSGIAYVYALDSLSGEGQNPADSQSISIGSDTDGGVNIGIPGYADGTVFISNGSQGAEQRGLVAYSDSGCALQRRWAFVDPSQQQSPNSPPTIANGVVYDAGGADNVVRAFDENSGNVLWTGSMNGPAFAAPTIADGEVLVSSWDHSVHVYGAPVTGSNATVRRPGQ